MADIPQPKSFEQLSSSMLSALASKLGVDDFSVGSALTSFVEVVALTTAQTSGGIFQALASLSIDRASGDLLKRIATDSKVALVTARPATGSVIVTDISFNKISTKVYAGANPPNIGSTEIKVSDASLFTSTGSVYIGRGTPNIEGPIPYSSITPTGGLYIVNLTSPTAKFHNVGETVILAQGGNRSIPVNSIAVAPASGASQDVQFTVTSSAIILDGETSVSGVQVAAQEPGSSGNVPRGGIKKFSSPPFVGATVTNDLPFTTGKDNENDVELRVRIKRKLASTGLGTDTVIEGAVIGATSSDESATIVSSKMVRGVTGSTLYVDDGNGYEEKSNGVGLESIVDSALGGEKFFQLITGGRQAPVAKAFLETAITGPFDLIVGDTLAIIVGDQTFEHVFQNSDFRSPGGATAFEITASINANTALGFEALTSEGGQKVVIRSKEEGNDSVQTTTPSTSERDASVLLDFPSNEIQTIRLYKNNIPLSKDGSSASIFTKSQENWSATIATGETLILSVDGTGYITYTITDADFIATGLYNSVSKNNSLESWVQVLNAKLTGVTVSEIGAQLRITSNLGVVNRASLAIDPSSSLVSKAMFDVISGLTAQGKTSDFMLLRNTAQVQLAVALVSGDKLSGGSLDTEARIESDLIPSGNITPLADGHIWILTDTPGSVIQTGLTGNSLIGVSKPSTNTIRYTSSITSAFSTVHVGDYAIVWSENVSASNRLEGRVHAVTATTLDILVTSTEYAASVVEPSLLFTDGIVILRSTRSPQKFKITSGTKTLAEVAEELQLETKELTFSVEREELILVKTNTKDSTGSILIVTADVNGKTLQFPINGSDQSKDSLIAFYDTKTEDSQFPLFLHAMVATGTSADPIDSYISSFTSSVSLSGRDPNEMISILEPYGSIADAQPAGETDQETSVSGTTIGISPQPLIRRLRNVDRFFLANPLDFGFNDTIVAVLDGDATSKSFEIPLYRKAKTNTSLANNPSNFNAYDTDSGPTSSFVSAFPDFDFSNFKVLMQAKKVLKPNVSQSALLFRASKWGRSGEKVNVGYIYPSSANQGISNSITVNSTVDVRISLKSGTSVSTSIDSSTQWNVTVAANTPSAGIDQVTYTWDTLGTDPALSLSGGEYVNISSQTSLNANNTGIFKVSSQGGFTPTSHKFSVQMPTGVAVAESDKSTTVNSGMLFYQSSATTAAQINTYVNSSLSDYVTSTIVNDGGSAGSGVIALSTFEDSGFQYKSQYLQDGINWILSNDTGGATQFTFKKSLALSSDVGYAFNNGENIRLIPTTMDQVKRLISILAVTGFTTVGSVNLVDAGSRIELATAVLGSDGSIQIIGGLANGYSTAVLDSAVKIDNNLMSVSANKVSAQGISSDQWLRLQALTAQRKDTLLSSNSSVKVQGNFPTAGQSTITLLGKLANQRYLGKPRHHIRSLNDTFRVEKQGSLVCVSWNNVGSSPTFLKAALNLNDGSGGTVDFTKVMDSSEIQIAILTGAANFNELSIGDLLTIANQNGNNGTFPVISISDNGQTIRLLNQSGSEALGSTFIAGDFSASSSVGEGDTVVFSSPFASLNQGRYRVIRRYNDSIWIENSNAIEEEVTLSANLQSLGFDGSTDFKVNATNHSAYVNWNGTGTEPNLGTSRVGDIVTFGNDFMSVNRGSFMVSRSGVALKEVTELTMPIASQFATSGVGKYFNLNSAGDVNLYYVWFQVGTTTDPTIGGRVGIQVTITAGMTASQVATATAVAIAAVSGGTKFTASATNEIATISTVGSIETTIAVNVTMPTPFSVNRTQAGRRTFLECINPSAVNESSVTISGVFTCHRPQLQFWEYEATVAGDKFVATGDTLTTPNAGTYDIVSVLDSGTMVVTGNMASIQNASLNGRETSIYTLEGTPYSGYKHVLLTSAQPGSTTRTEIVFDSNFQFGKIDESASVSMTSVSKLDFPTTTRKGLDSYRYNTGLIAESNRIIYGDPRSPETYPGVGAAGSDIFTRSPLVRRIQVSIVIRINTGVPFSSVAEQVRTTVGSLVNSNPVGQPIAISAIVGAINEIPGCRAVSISSPQYDSTHDLLFVAPSEKALIIDASVDVSVSQVGT